MRDRSLERARTIAVEQSVEMPLEAIDDPFVNSEIVGRVLDIKDVGGKGHWAAALFEVRIALARPQPTSSMVAMPGS